MNEESQVTENLQVAQTALPNSMSAQEVDIVKQVAEACRSRIEVPCTGCKYCMPCPNGVNIPSNFGIYNDYCMFGEEMNARWLYSFVLLGGRSGKRSDAALCQKCGVCVERCPQHIAIPEQLKVVAEKLGGPKTEAMVAAMKAQEQKPAT
jgi:predicted aldo/keto reductase-like oxidoreductase